MRVVRSLLEGFKVFNSVESCEEFVSRMALSDRIGSCKENVRRNDKIFD